MNTSIQEPVEINTQGAAAKAGKYLTFFLDKEEYGLEILKVMEIIKFIKIVQIPNVPGYVKGVINLRGKVYPIIDLRLKFKMPSIEATKETCIIVVNLQDIIMGILVDTVSEVLDIDAKDIEPPPAFGSAVNINFILGMAKVNNEIKILLDIDKVLKADQVIAIKSSTDVMTEQEKSAA